MSINEHESIRARLALAAADALTPEERLQVERHVRECESCRRELELWGSYAQGLRQQPQPTIPPDLLARTQAAVLRDREHVVERRRNGWMFCALAAYSWAISFSVWIVARTLSGGTLEVFGANLVSASTWMLTSFVFSWVTAGAAAVILSSSHQTRRVL